MSSAPSPGTTPAPAPPNNSTSPPSPPVTSPPPTVTPPPSPTPPDKNSTAPPPQPPVSPPPSSPPGPPNSPPPRDSPPTPVIPSPPSPNSPSPPGTPSPPSRPSDGSSTPRTPSGPRHSSPPPPPSDSNGVSRGMVVGIAIGGAVVLVVLTLLLLCCKKKRRRRGDEAGYYVAPPPRKDGPYGHQQPQYWQQQNIPPPSDHMVTSAPVKPPPQWSPAPPSNSLPHAAAAAPPPPLMYSSGGSCSNYSGPDNNPILPPPSPGIVLGFSKSTFTYEELARATDGFTEANLLGQGGFGYVHKGVLPSGKEVAVKHLKAGSGQGEREFQAEVEIISRVHHKHLVSLVGYCISATQRMLVYEFVPNNTLEFHLHGKEHPTMDWSTRLKIALGSAKGLSYLHEDCNPKIIHRDIKAANILLDFRFEAKVADFGLARMASDTNTHVSTRVMGTFGYLAPEYASSGKLTEKSDVFSFGVVLLELITGRRPVDPSHAFFDDSLVDWARPLLSRASEEGKFDGLADPKLSNEYDGEEMARMVACAAACVRHSARRRPRMSQIVRALEGNVSLSDLNEGMRPGHSSLYSSYGGSTDYDTSQYNEDLKRFRKTAIGTGEYSNPTSDYGLYPSGSSSEAQTTREMIKET